MIYWTRFKKAVRLALSPLLLLLYAPGALFAQGGRDTLAQTLKNNATLENIIRYALKNQPLIQQLQIDEDITKSQIRSKLSDWYPQVNFGYNYQRNFLLQTSIIAGNPVKFGVNNTSNAQFTLSQQIFNRDVLLADRTRKDVEQLSGQNTKYSKTQLAANVAKAFYDVLTTLQQISVTREDIVRLERSLKDAENQYKAGIVDKIDYKRATISLNNTRTGKKAYEETLKAKLEYLKSLMGYPNDQELKISYDTLQMEKEITLDTAQQASYASRIEYQLLTTRKKLLQANLLYNKWSYLPNISFNGAYNFNFQNNKFIDLYSKNYPTSFAAITLSLPLYQGGKRKESKKQAEWQIKRLDLDIADLKTNVNAEYTAALARYKSNLSNLLTQKENTDLAREVYNIIQLQYKSGIKTYLEVVTSETDLRLARINYYNALYEVLSSKIDVQKALGQLNY